MWLLFAKVTSTVGLVASYCIFFFSDSASPIDVLTIV